MLVGGRYGILSKSVNGFLLMLPMCRRLCLFHQDSECLMNFLWEPATDIPSTNCMSVLDTINSSSFTGASNKFKSSPSLTTLGSIKEMDYDTDGDDSADEDVGFSADGWKQ